jgi:hypothetical protein
MSPPLPVLTQWAHTVRENDGDGDAAATTTETTAAAARRMF